MTEALETSGAQKSALDIPVGSLIKTTLVDFPGRVSASFFLRGCNLRCPYCYNAELVLTGSEGNGSDKNTDGSFSVQAHSTLSTINELFAHLEKRRNVLSGLVISGGEPLLNEYTPVIIQKAKSLGYKIKLDTNGTLPDTLQKFLCDENLRPDFVAMDIKTSPHRYAKMLLGQKKKTVR